MSQVAMIARLIAVVVAIVSGIVDVIPFAAAILIVLGVVASPAVEEDQRAPLMLATLVLLGVGGELSAIPAVGDILAAIINNLGLAYLGAALGVILTVLAQRLKP
jgi:hypothetical protein